MAAQPKNKMSSEEGATKSLTLKMEKAMQTLAAVVEQAKIVEASSVPGSEYRLNAHHAKVAADVCLTNLKMSYREIGRASNGRLVSSQLDS